MVIWAELRLIDKIRATVWVRIQQLEKSFTLLGFESFLEIPRIICKSLPHPWGIFSMLSNPAKCHIRQKSCKSINWVAKPQIFRAPPSSRKTSQVKSGAQKSINFEMFTEGVSAPQTPPNKSAWRPPHIRFVLGFMLAYRLAYALLWALC